MMQRKSQIIYYEPAAFIKKRKISGTYPAFLLLLICIMIPVSSCSINKMAIDAVAGMLSGEESLVFTGDDDPDLIGDALPFALKLYESLIEADPRNPRLLLAAGKAFCLYAYAYVQTPAEMLGDTDNQYKVYLQTRAKKLYLRAKAYLFSALCIENPGFKNTFENGKTAKDILLITGKNLPFLYWHSAAWMGAITADPFDVSLMITLPQALSCIERIIEIDDTFDKGSAHELLISYYGSLPEGMGGSEEKARHHLKKALDASRGLKAGPYMAFAASVCISKQYLDEFRTLLDAALAIKTDSPSDLRLMNMIARKKALWYMEHIEDFFLSDVESEEE